MGAKFAVGDRVVNKAHPDQGIGEVVYVEADEYSFENFHYGVAYKDRVGPNAPAIPYDNYHHLEKVDECTHYRNEAVCPACGNVLTTDAPAAEQ